MSSVQLALRLDSREVERLFDGFESRAKIKCVARAVRAAARVAVPVARRLAPKDTGALRRSLALRATGARHGSRWVRVRVISRADALGKDAYYASWQEFGWHAGRRHAATRSYRRLQAAAARAGRDLVARERGGRARRRRWIEGRHFMARAVQQTRTQMVAAAQETFAQAVQAEFARAYGG